MKILTTVLHRVNKYAAAFRFMFEVEQEQNAIAAQNATEPPVVTMYIKREHDQRRYNEPRHDEVVAVFVSNDGMSW